MPQFPIYYGTQLVDMADMRRRFEPIMHVEYARRLFAWIESEDGDIGIGSGHRSHATQLRLWLSDPRRFARPGNSFHEEHKWASGVTAYAAVDLVHISDGRHRSPTWSECDSAKDYGLHTFIRNEPWHMQLIETRSASVWKSVGKPDPAMINLPSSAGPAPVPVPHVHVPHVHTPAPTPPPAPKPAFKPGDDDVITKLPTLKKGDKGIHVKIVQDLLRLHGAGITVDGDFGNQTDSIVRYVQGMEGLTKDGIVGPRTWSVILKVS